MDFKILWEVNVSKILVKIVQILETRRNFEYLRPISENWFPVNPKFHNVISDSLQFKIVLTILALRRVIWTNWTEHHYENKVVLVHMIWTIWYGSYHMRSYKSNQFMQIGYSSNLIQFTQYVNINFWFHLSSENDFEANILFSYHFICRRYIWTSKRTLCNSIENFEQSTEFNKNAMQATWSFLSGYDIRFQNLRGYHIRVIHLDTKLDTQDWYTKSYKSVSFLFVSTCDQKSRSNVLPPIPMKVFI